MMNVFTRLWRNFFSSYFGSRFSWGLPRDREELIWSFLEFLYRPTRSDSNFTTMSLLCFTINYSSCARPCSPKNTRWENFLSCVWVFFFYYYQHLNLTHSLFCYLLLSANFFYWSNCDDARTHSLSFSLLGEKFMITRCNFYFFFLHLSLSLVE